MKQLDTIFYIVGIGAVLYFGSAILYGIRLGIKRALSGQKFPHVFCYSLQFKESGEWSEGGEILWIIPLIDQRTGKHVPYDENAWKDIHNTGNETSHWYIPDGKMPFNGFPEDIKLRKKYFQAYPELMQFFRKHGLDVMKFKFEQKNEHEKIKHGH